MKSRDACFVDVVLPLAIGQTYTYRVPQDLVSAVGIGKRVIVQFGRNRIYSAIVYQVSDKPPLRYEAKYLLDIIDEEPIVHPVQFALWEWMASYYLCTLGEVMQAALPAALKLASETVITKGRLEDVDRQAVDEQEYLILEALDIASELKIKDIVTLLGQKTVFPILKRMFEKELISISEELAPKFKPRRQQILELAPDFQGGEGLRNLLDALNRAPKQQDAVLAFTQLAKNSSHVTRREVMEAASCSASVITALVEKQFFVQKERIVSRIGGEDVEIVGEFDLNDLQGRALQEINSAFEDKEVVLLHGVTSSGKTQLYIRLIEECIAEGKQALYLLPEIALTTQMTGRLRTHFGEQVAVYHSRFNDNERTEVWQKVQQGKIQLVIGARSSVFLPFDNLGVVIVDEEHETSYKQMDPAPRYHARDTAIYLGHLQGAKVLLGSATPSIESYYNARAEKYGLVSLPERYGDSHLPEIQVVDIKEETRKGLMQTYFSKTLLEGMVSAIEHKKQVILFQNRRGHTPLSICKTCGYTAKCLHCDVSLTYHKSSGRLHCHYCGYTESSMIACPACESTQIESRGGGTERIEEELQVLLPDIRIGRLDLDSARGKHGFERILSEFDDRQFDVLIGTQMIAKGLDFSNVALIGVVQADSLINFPDFRAYERAFSLFAQVAGRAGRRTERGKVYIQTYNPEHRVIKQVVDHDFHGMFMTEIQERKQFKYPPFYRMIRIDVRHREQYQAEAGAVHLAGLLRQQLDERVLGPEAPLVSRIRNQYIQRILLKVERTGVSIAKVKDFVKHSLILFQSDKSFKGFRIVLDVDPI